MLVVAGLSLKNLEPRVWDVADANYLPRLRAVMVSYGEFHRLPAARRIASTIGLRRFLSAPDHVKIYLDNGAFSFVGKSGPDHFAEYDEFVQAAKPDWWPIPRDFIPIPKMTASAQRACFDQTMAVNRQYEHDGFVPVVHIGRHLKAYIDALSTSDTLRSKPRVALGGIVPNLLRAPKALGYEVLLSGLRHARQAFSGKEFHIFGVGGTATLHIAALLGFDSVDSSGWRNRAARGIVQLPGSGDRVVAELGSWRGRRPSTAEWKVLRGCPCPACVRTGTRGLKASGLAGFSNRAVHNLWVLLDEEWWVSERLRVGTYSQEYQARLDNSTYAPIIAALVNDSTDADQDHQLGAPLGGHSRKSTNA